MTAMNEDAQPLKDLIASHQEYTRHVQSLVDSLGVVAIWRLEGGLAPPPDYPAE
jgi:hypothetical protein